MPAKKVLYLLPQPYLLSRGSSFRALATVEMASELGYQVDLLCYPIGTAPRSTPYNIYRSSPVPFIKQVKIGPSRGKCIIDLPFAYKAWQLIKNNQYDLLHGVEEAGLIASHFGRKLKIPYLYDMHSWMSQQIEDSKFIKSKFILNNFKKFELQAMNNAKAIITVGPHMTELLQGMAPGVPAYSLFNCPLNFQESLDPAWQMKIKQQFFSQGDRVIVYTGNFHTYQGIDLLIESIFELKKLTQDHSEKFRLLLVGGGAGEEEAISKFKKKIATLDLKDEIVFCGEFPAEAMPIFMEGANLLVSSRIQGNNVPLKIYTYLASGKLLAATNISSHTQILNPQNSLLADPEPKAMAAIFYQGLYQINQQEKEKLVSAAQKLGGVEQKAKFKTVLKDCYGYALL